jgi:hypothetical protein
MLPIGNAEMTSSQVAQGLMLITGLRTGEPICEGAMASVLVLQSADGQPQRIEVDGAVIEFDSAIAFRANRSTDAFENRPSSNPQVLHLIVLDGSASIAGQQIEAGFTAMSAADSQSSERLGWVGERPLNDEEFALLAGLASLDIPLPPR